MRRAVLAALVLVSLAVVSPALAATDGPTAVAIPTLSAEAQTVEAFAPDGWTVEDKTSGDLDGDGRDDAAFMLRPNDPAYRPPSDGFKMDASPRILAVAVAAGGGFRLAAQNATLVPRHAQEGVEDSFEGALKIERARLKVIFDLLPGMGSWEEGRTFTLKLSNGRLTLVGFDMTNVQRGPGDIATTNVNYLSGKMSVAKGSIESDKDDGKVWTKLRTKRAPTIDEIGDGVAFDPTR